MDNRFYVTKENAVDAAVILIDEKGFEQLDNACDDEFAKGTMVFIDKEKKTFYFIDKENLNQSNAIIVEKHKQTYKTVTIKDIKKWS